MIAVKISIYNSMRYNNNDKRSVMRSKDRNRSSISVGHSRVNNGSIAFNSIVSLELYWELGILGYCTVYTIYPL